MNNNQIDNTDYYRLPCGKYLEDFIASRWLTFAMGSALKYMWRAGRKDGESAEHASKKALHYIKFEAKHFELKESTVIHRIDDLLDEARNWDGKSKMKVMCDEKSM